MLHGAKSLVSPPLLSGSGLQEVTPWMRPSGAERRTSVQVCTPKYSNLTPLVTPREAPTQSVCETNLSTGGGGTTTTVTIPSQKVLAVAVVPTNYQPWSDIMAKHLNNLMATKYKTSTVKVRKTRAYLINQFSTNCSPVLLLCPPIWILTPKSGFTILPTSVIPLLDISPNSSVSPNGTMTEPGKPRVNFTKVNLFFRKNLIVDGRILSESYAVSGYPGESRYEVYENYFANLAIRGGGLMLGTDHDVFANGINVVNDDIGISRFHAVISGTKCTADKKSPLMTWPNYAPLPDV